MPLNGKSNFTKTKIDVMNNTCFNNHYYKSKFYAVLSKLHLLRKSNFND